MINHFKPRTFVFALALTTSFVAFAQEGGKGDPDRAVAGGQFPRRRPGAHGGRAGAAARGPHPAVQSCLPRLTHGPGP